MHDIGVALRACWRAPASPRGGYVTLSFSFRRDGSLIAAPRPAAIALQGDSGAQAHFVAAAIADLRRCTPLALVAALGEAIAGRSLAMSFPGAAGR